MAGKNTAVFGIYRDRFSVESAVDTLREEQFRNTDVSVLFPENVGTKDFAHEKSSKAPEGATAGATTGSVVGGALGWLAGLGALAIPRGWSVHGGGTNRGTARRRWRGAARSAASPQR